MKMEKILVFAAHPDDAEIGMGGTIAKYSENKDKIITLIFTKGEKSHPHIKEEVIARKRKSETKNVDELLKRKSIHLDLDEGKLKQYLNDDKLLNEIKEIINKFKPTKVYTLSSSDPHPDHRSVNEITLKILEELKFKGDIYAYEVWNVVEDNHAKVYVDITETFGMKKRVLKEFKSQMHFIYPLLPLVHLRARLYGKRYNCRYAEKFYKIK